VAPTFEKAASFGKDYAKLTSDQRTRVRRAVSGLVDDLQAGRRPRPGLRVRGVQGTGGVFELTWAPDGRATFSFGKQVHSGEAHIVWRRIGTHEVFRRP